MALSTLPEDPLLEVLSHLTSLELLQCRMVCKRLSELALHPWLWVNKSVRFHAARSEVIECNCLCSTSMRLMAAILQLVPSLGRLSIYDFDQLAEDVGGLLLSTRCSVSGLNLDFSASNATLVATTLARQSSLGRLKMVYLKVRAVEQSRRGALCGLLLQLVQMHGLETLRLKYSSDGTVLPALLGADQVDDPPPSSLRQLEYSSELSDLDPYLHLLLMRHAATLEVVDILAEDPQLAPLLSTMANLRDLTCVPLEGMSALLQCPSLKSLQLVIDAVPHPSLRAARDYLCAAVARLECLVLEYGFEESNDAVDLMLCLAGSGAAAPALREFAFCSTSESMSARLQRHLASVLRRLPNLRHLRMYDCSPTADFLAALDGTVLLNLVLLHQQCPAEFECTHEWAHSMEVERVLRKYPRLHIVAGDTVQQGDCGCDFCEEHKCHAIPPGSRCLVYCHDPRDNCTEPFCCDDDMYKIHISLESRDASCPTAPEPSE